MGACKKGSACPFIHSINVDNRYMGGNEFQPNFPQMNFNPDNNFPQMIFNPDNNYPNPYAQTQSFPVNNNDDAHFHANNFLQNFQQPSIQESYPNTVEESNVVINEMNNYIDSDDDIDEIVNKEIIPKIWALEDSSLLISKNLCGLELFQKVMKLRGIDGNNNNDNNNDNNTSQSLDNQLITNSNENNTENAAELGLDDLLASIDPSTHVEEKESTIDDLFALMGDDDKNIDDNYDNQEMDDDHKSKVDGESNINQENEAEEDDMYGDLYGDIEDDNNVEEQKEDTVNSDSNIHNNADDDNMVNSYIKEKDKISSIDNENHFIKHAIRKEIPFYLQNMSYDRLNIFHNPQGGFGVVHLLNNIVSLLKNDSA